MPKIWRIVESNKVIEVLQRRNLLKQYRKAKLYLLAGSASKVSFKQRRPKGSNVWSFRINKQFRAFATFNSKEELVVFQIYNHQ